MLISIGELLKNSWQFFRQNIRMVIKYALLSLVPLVIGFAGVVIFLPFSTALISGQDSTLIIVFGIIGLLFALAISYLSLWFNFAYVHAVHSKLTNNLDENIRLSTTATHPYVWRGFIGMIISGVYIAAPFLISLVLIGLSSALNLSAHGLIGNIISKLIILVAIYGFFHAIYYSIRLNLFIYEIVLQGKKIKPAILHSFTLVKGRWWSFFIRIFVLVLILATLSNILGQIGSIIGKNEIITFIYSAIIFTINLILSQIASIYTILIYKSAGERQ